MAESKDKKDNDYKLKPGEKYLAIDLSGLTVQQLVKAAQEPIAVFPNRNKTEDKHPDYKSRGVAVWVNEYTGERSA